MACNKQNSCPGNAADTTTFSHGISKAELRNEIMAIDFAVTDIKLYLNTHPDDADAIRLYNSLVEKRLAMFDSYQSMFGPLIAETYTGSVDEWDWIDNPWPWNKEV